MSLNTKISQNEQQPWQVWNSQDSELGMEPSFSNDIVFFTRKLLYQNLTDYFKPVVMDKIELE